MADEFGVKKDTVYRLAKRRNVAVPKARGRDPMIGFRLSADELKAFDALVADRGFKSRSELARVLARGALGFLEVSREERADLEEIKTELSRIGTNINQLARAANRGRVDLVRTQWEDVSELRAALPRVNTYLLKVVAELRRRGVQLWRKSEYGS